MDCLLQKVRKLLAGHWMEDMKPVSVLVEKKAGFGRCGNDSCTLENVAMYRYIRQNLKYLRNLRDLN